MYKNLSCPEKTKDICQNLVIRDLENDEKDAAMGVLKNTFPHIYEVDKTLWSDLLDLDTTLALEMNGEIVGVSNIRRPTYQNNKLVSWVNLIAVDENHQSKGLGSPLLRESELVMKDSGAKVAKLHTEVDNTEGVAFYSKHGWKVVDRTEWGYPHGHRLTMQKSLY